MTDDGDLRMLGACDGFAHSLIRVRSFIAQHDGLYAPRIHPRHTRKAKRRDDILAPLKALEAYLLQSHADCKEAYQRSLLRAKSEGPQWVRG